MGHIGFCIFSFPIMYSIFNSSGAFFDKLLWSLFVALFFAGMFYDKKYGIASVALFFLICFLSFFK